MDEYELDEAAEWADWHRRLNLARPDHYKTGDYSWAADLRDEAKNLAIETKLEEVLDEWTLAKVRVAERRSTARANDLLRSIAVDGALPLDWMDFADYPIVIEGERHKLGSCSTTEFQMWELYERRRASQDFTARNAACDGAQLLVEWMQSQGADRLRDLGQ